MYSREPVSFSRASQLGRHEWLIQRAALPCWPPSMILPLLSEKKNVWLGSSGLYEGSSSASSGVMRLPRYSMMQVSAGISRAAKTPFPCREDGRTTYQRGALLRDMGAPGDKSTTLYAISSEPGHRTKCEYHRKLRARSARRRAAHVADTHRSGCRYHLRLPRRRGFAALRCTVFRTPHPSHPRTP